MLAIKLDAGIIDKAPTGEVVRLKGEYTMANTRDTCDHFSTGFLTFKNYR